MTTIRFKKSKWLGIVLVMLAILLYLIVQKYYLAGQFTPEGLRTFFLQFGIWAPVVYMATMAMAIVISPLPSLPLDAASGMIWGPVIGTVYSVIGAEIGAITAFLIARSLGRGWVEKRFKRKMNVCDGVWCAKLGWIVFVSRLLPIFQFDIVSYAAGLTNMKTRTFAIATFFGMIPATFLFAYFGEQLIFGGVFTTIVTILVIVGMFTVPLIVKKKGLFSSR